MVKNKSKFYSEISIDSIRQRTPQTNSFREAKLFYANKKYEQWKFLIEQYKIPTKQKEILLKYDFSWFWVWENMTKEEIINNFYN